MAHIRYWRLSLHTSSYKIQSRSVDSSDHEDVMKAKGELVKAAKKLMWERGYEAVSPRDLLEESGAGQGSLYHHFKGKMDLASLREVSDEMCEFAREIVGTDGSALDRVI